MRHNCNIQSYRLSYNNFSFVVREALMRSCKSTAGTDLLSDTDQNDYYICNPKTAPTKYHPSAMVYATL